MHIKYFYLIICINFPSLLCFNIFPGRKNVYLVPRNAKENEIKNRKLKSSFVDAEYASKNTNGSFIITTPLFYINGDPHLGHSYTVVFADVIKRFLELKGNDVKLLVGTDEHGSKIERRSKLFNQDPADYVSEYRSKFLNMFNAYDISSDISIHTDEEKNKLFVRQIFKILLKRGFIYRGIHKGYFSPKEDLYFPQSQVSDGKSPQGFDVIPVNEPAYFFKLSSWRKKLTEFFIEHKTSVVPETRYSEIMKILESELPDVAITRRNYTWGVKIPCVCDITPPVDCAIHGSSNYGITETFYVWFDAFLGYLSGILSLSDENIDQILNDMTNKITNEIHRKSVLIQVIGKDILTFHSFLWPAILFSLGIQPFDKFYIHGWILCKGEKMSKSYGSVTPAMPLHSSDISRFMLMTLGQFGNDFEFHSSNFRQSENTVRNTFAAACYRVTGLLNIRWNGKIEFPGKYYGNILDTLGSDQDILEGYITTGRVDRYMEHLETMAIKINKFLTLNKVWKLRPEEQNFKDIIWTACSSLLCLAVHTLPIMPKLARTIISRLNPELNDTPIDQNKLRFAVLDSLERINYSPVHGEPLI
ncbi:methionine-tRNA synthetase, putative [Theileria equi strain WA]|uniref:methionine--tRNA ligase n=1 Tax=Theileria equi strain WA TaxID=1537102 RepID=L1LG49_THEEQ|nr:methionine-tRNA synthetase, putative [Theileria equi strain WA]EKX74239.1 methionine-tRNA synthetase, putative [Theileria equi strain WA]|eukprot:XP_004833691.1 methionine-tRNA synthetase, putative [Theileria equi strain WA]